MIIVPGVMEKQAYFEAYIKCYDGLREFWG